MDLPTRALIEERLSPDIDGRLRTGLPLSRQVLVRPRLAALNWSCHLRPGLGAVGNLYWHGHKITCCLKEREVTDGGVVRQCPPYRATAFTVFK